ncbi:hypothetical protein HU200_038903 [Digitaria exilis]|uniref:DUF569 domain-containing protein n=1 Tax=Digitaria exilis TaxID=1010633 RepID=A0A835BHQ1_9POAL|nr:hypothetical protein HU200_038903 [Digitaria exilis]
MELLLGIERTRVTRRRRGSSEKAYLQRESRRLRRPPGRLGFSCSGRRVGMAPCWCQGVRPLGSAGPSANAITNSSSLRHRLRAPANSSSLRHRLRAPANSSSLRLRLRALSRILTASSTSEGARGQSMEGFLGAHLVRLRCDVRGRGCNYLTADEDARGERASIWALEFAEGWALFRSDYGGYLSAANNIARTGGRSGVVLAVGQHLMPVRNQAPPEMLWRSARREGHVVLRNRAGGYLRANGRYNLRWSTAVSVAEDDTTPRMMWTVEVVPMGLLGEDYFW